MCGKWLEAAVGKGGEVWGLGTSTKAYRYLSTRTLGQVLTYARGFRDRASIAIAVYSRGNRASWAIGPR